MRRARITYFCTDRKPNQAAFQPASHTCRSLVPFSLEFTQSLSNQLGSIARFGRNRIFFFYCIIAVHLAHLFHCDCFTVWSGFHCKHSISLSFCIAPHVNHRSFQFRLPRFVSVTSSKTFNTKHTYCVPTNIIYICNESISFLAANKNKTITIAAHQPFRLFSVLIWRINKF